MTATTSALTEHAAPGPMQATPAAQLAVQAPGVALCAIGVGFAAATLSLANAHILDPATGGFFTPVAFGIGALALFCGGQWESRAGRMFSATFGVTYAGFLLTTAIILRFFAADVIRQAGPTGFDHAFGAYLLLWCAITTVLTVVAVKVNWAAFLAFLFLAAALLFAGLATWLGSSAGAGDTLNRTSGWFGLLDAAVAWYLAAAILINDTFGRDLLPLPTVGRSN